VTLAVGASTLVATCLVAPAGAQAPSGACAEPTLLGTAGDDHLVGTEGPDVIDAGDGQDVVDGLGGDDVICGGAGGDRLDGGAGDDVLLGGLDGYVDAPEPCGPYRIGDVLVSGPGDDVLDAGPDPRSGEPLDVVTFEGSAAAVTVDLGAGMALGEGEDRLVGPWGRVRLSPHADVLRGSDGVDDVQGEGGGDRLAGGPGDDRLNLQGEVGPA